MNIADLFPDEDYKFQLGLRRGSAAEFFGPTPDRAALLAERRRWLRAAP